MKKTIIFLLHAGYWLLYLLLILSVLALLAKGRAPAYRLAEVLLLTPLTIFSFLPGILGFYSFYCILFDRFLHQKKVFLLLLFGGLFTLACGAITFLVLSIPGVRGYGPIGISEKIRMVFFLSMLAGIHGIIGLVLKGFISWYGDIRLKEELNKKNNETELALVRSRIHPHFLFNTINNIDVLIEKDPAKASLYLNKLSDIMRFMLYETRTEQIALSRELAYIEKYIDLQRIRTANASYVTYAVEGEAGDLMIAPLLFIPYIENAFKHAEYRKNEAAICIKLQIGDDNILFDCENKYSRSAASGDHNGLGNELLQKRLALLYPHRHSLEIMNQGGVYKVKLMLQTHAS